MYLVSPVVWSRIYLLTVPLTGLGRVCSLLVSHVAKFHMGLNGCFTCKKLKYDFNFRQTSVRKLNGPKYLQSSIKYLSSSKVPSFLYEVNSSCDT